MRAEAPPGGRSVPVPALDGDAELLRDDVAASMAAVLAPRRSRLVRLEPGTRVPGDGEPRGTALAATIRAG